MLAKSGTLIEICLEGVGNDVFGGNYVLAGKAVFVRSNRSKFGTDFAPPVGQNSLKIVQK